MKLPISIRSTETEARFRRMIGTPDANGCWPWTGSIRPDGYGTFGVKNPETKRYNTSEYAHRVSYTLFVGEIEKGKVLDHTCRNRRCVNPSHLEPVEFRENVLRGEAHAARNAVKTHCPKGHPLSGENLKLDKRPNGKVARRCRQCANAAVAKSTLKRKQNG